jgi:hypothetical protein
MATVQIYELWVLLERLNVDFVETDYLKISRFYWGILFYGM